jgi:hypothetical protein
MVNAIGSQASEAVERRRMEADKLTLPRRKQKRFMEQFKQAMAHTPLFPSIFELIQCWAFSK